MKQELIALHKHWVTADAIKQLILRSVPIADPVARLPNEFQVLANVQSQALRLCTFYALIYVVIEGYKQISNKHQCLDLLLARNDHVDALRRFRNGIFHFQEDPLSEKLTVYLESPDSEKWIQDVYEAFQDFFEENLPVRETIKHLKLYDKTTPKTK